MNKCFHVFLLFNSTINALPPADNDMWNSISLSTCHKNLILNRHPIFSNAEFIGILLSFTNGFLRKVLVQLISEELQFCISDSEEAAIQKSRGRFSSDFALSIADPSPYERHTMELV